MDKASPTEAAEETGSGALEENFRTIISSGVCAKSTDIYSRMEYEHNFLENFIRFDCTALYFFCLNIYLLYKLFVIIMFIHVIYFLQFFLNKKSVNKDKLLQCCRHCRFSNGLRY